MTRTPAPKKVQHICHACKVVSWEYPQRMSRGLVKVLEALARLKVDKGQATVQRKQLRWMTPGQYNTIHQLAYWNLAQPTSDKRTGTWRITDEGMDFIQGKMAILKTAWTLNGEVIKYEGPEIYVEDVIEGYKFFADAVAERRAPEPAEAGRQLTLALRS